MILKNNKGVERQFEILFEVEKEDHKYIIYKDPLNDNIYGGKYKEDKLVSLEEDELEYLNKMIEKLNG